jgi:hypothetical protein
MSDFRPFVPPLGKARFFGLIQAAEIRPDSRASKGCKRLQSHSHDTSHAALRPRAGRSRLDCFRCLQIPKAHLIVSSSRSSSRAMPHSMRRHGGGLRACRYGVDRVACRLRARSNHEMPRIQSRLSKLGASGHGRHSASPRPITNSKSFFERKSISSVNIVTACR